MDSYYQGIMSNIESEVNLINGLFNHQGVKGSGNEEILVQLLKNFLPKKYGIGTGVVIDVEGTQSKQCDIIIFDAINYPAIFSLTESKFYPVDFVYATIEIKTKINKTKFNDSVENIKSVQSLNYLKQDFRTIPTDPVYKLDKDTVLFNTQNTTQPLGLVFSYSSITNNFDTFSSWFNSSTDDLGPTHVFCLDQGILVDSKKKGIIKTLLPFIKDDKAISKEQRELLNLNGQKWAEVDGKMMVFSKIAGKYVAIDQSKILFQFLVIINELLKNKLLSPNISVYESYLSKSNKTIFTVINGKLVATVIE